MAFGGQRVGTAGLLADVPGEHSLGRDMTRTNMRWLTAMTIPKIGIKSTAILFSHHDKLIIGILQVAVLGADGGDWPLNRLNWEVYWSVLVAGCCLFISKS